MTPPPNPSYKSRLRALFLQGQKVVFARNGTIVSAYDDPNGINFIESGYVKVFGINTHGDEYVHIIYGPGEIFPLAWLLHEERRSVHYTALSEVIAYRMDATDLEATLLKDSEAGYGMTQQTIEQFKIYTNRIINLEYKFARERLAYRLLFLGSRFSKRDGKHYRLEVPMTQQLLATSINLSRETVSREFDRLVSKKLVEFDGRRIILCDVEGLFKELPESDKPTWWNFV